MLDRFAIGSMHASEFRIDVRIVSSRLLTCLFIGRIITSPLTIYVGSAPNNNYTTLTEAWNWLKVRYCLAPVVIQMDCSQAWGWSTQFDFGASPTPQMITLRGNPDNPSTCQILVSGDITAFKFGRGSNNMIMEGFKFVASVPGEGRALVAAQTSVQFLNILIGHLNVGMMTETADVYMECTLPELCLIEADNGVQAHDGSRVVLGKLKIRSDVVALEVRASRVSSWCDVAANTAEAKVLFCHSASQVTWWWMGIGLGLRDTSQSCTFHSNI